MPMILVDKIEVVEEILFVPCRKYKFFPTFFFLEEREIRDSLEDEFSLKKEIGLLRGGGFFFETKFTNSVCTPWNREGSSVRDSQERETRGREGVWYNGSA